MQPPICARCKKNVAVVFITKMENGKTVNEGLCLKCAKELNIRPVEDLMQLMEQDTSFMRDWDPDYGDRMVKIVFIGQNMDKEALTRELDACLEE